MKVPAKLAAEWAAKLLETGFEDLEGHDRDAPLSNRGLLHAVADTDEDHDRVAVRMEHGSAYTDWAMDVLRRLNGRRRTARQRRKIWQLHADGWGFRVIAKDLGLGFHHVRETVNAIEEKYRQCTTIKTRKARLLYLRSLDTPTLAKLGAALVSATRS